MPDCKEKFVAMLGNALKLYSREEVDSMRYVIRGERELAEITYTNGYKKYVDITCDSCIAVMSDVYKAML